MTKFFWGADLDDACSLISTPDINGDGLSDLVYYKDDQFHYALSDGTQAELCWHLV